MPTCDTHFLCLCFTFLNHKIQHGDFWLILLTDLNVTPCDMITEHPNLVHADLIKRVKATGVKGTAKIVVLANIYI